MSCTHCGTPLPSGALFCGECGRSVASAKAPQAVNAGTQLRPESTGPSSAGSKKSGPVRWVEDPVTGNPLIDDPDDIDQADEIDVEIGLGEVRCEQCDTPMGSSDIFCGECGFVSRSITKAFRSSDFTGETRPIDLSLRAEVEASAAVALAPAPEPEPEPVEEFTPEAEPDPTPKPAVQAAAVEPAPDLRQHDLVTPAVPVRRSAPPTPPAPVAAPRARVPAPRSFVPDDGDDDAGDLEATRIVSRISGNRFVLQFSTGESFTVHGSGLVGRNPQPEPGEFFDHLVRVLDSGKSVSKTHLEFGQEGGAFWLKDRFSGNGTIIREPDLSARRAEPDRRYRVVRGTRIDIGEQFFIVS